MTEAGRRPWRRRWPLLVAVAVVAAAAVWFVPILHHHSSEWPWGIWLLTGLGVTAGLLALLLLSPAPRWMQGSAWRNRSAAARLQTRLQGRWRRWWRVLAGLAGLVVLAGVVLLIWRVPPALYGYLIDPKDRATAEASTRTGIIAGLAGLAALGGLVFTARNVQINRRALEETQQANRDAHQREQDAQITSRYTQAIEQLGSNKLDVRLGGIYALGRIATDSPDRDHSTVVEVLGAYVREHCDPTYTDSEPSLAKVLGDFLQADAARGKPDTAVEPKPAKPKPATDVRVALTVLGRLPQREGVLRGDLSGIDLAGAELLRVDLTGFRLFRANLAGAVLAGANLTGADLLRADLTGARLAEANLTNADLSLVKLAGADLRSAKLPGVRLFRADLADADLRSAKLPGARLRDSNLTKAKLSQADLTDVDLAGVTLNEAHLGGAQWSEGTKWPPVLRKEVQAVSIELGDGRYRVRDRYVVQSEEPE